MVSFVPSLLNKKKRSSEFLNVLKTDWREQGNATVRDGARIKYKLMGVMVYF